MHRPLPFVFAGLFFISAAITRAQSLPSTQPPQTVVDTAAQNSASDQSSSTQKKVWTNEDFSASDPHSGVSTVGNRSKPTVRRTAPTGRNAKWYHDQIATLQAKLPPLDSQIASLQAAIDGKPAGDAKKSTRPYYGVRADDWSRELAELQKKRDDTLAQIAALQDRARHDGVPSSALP